MKGKELFSGDINFLWGTSQKVYSNSSSTNKVYQKIGLQSQTGINTSATGYGSHYSNLIKKLNNCFIMRNHRKKDKIYRFCHSKYGGKR